METKIGNAVMMTLLLAVCVLGNAVMAVEDAALWVKGKLDAYR